ncbi:SDR family oxidoreductase [Marinifilum fragile]|jgi:Dehydrogenases with different specificities (related to short-chain alcohol dehydrogenases)|uniref:SDR family oxidoreductase n=1 Tax=Marinifilum fragile TaxID=570161 RepID=UPI002AA63364|nr:SDR family oxidoreductase [Marinifilum fragile]
MDLNIKDQLFVVCGATSGFGAAVLKYLVQDGAKVIAIARGRNKLIELEKAYPNSIESFCADITVSENIQLLLDKIDNRKLSGVFVNAGGPPAMKTLETRIEDWDNAYHQLLRWKVELTQALVPLMIKESYGRVVFLESSSVKQPIDNLVLSTSLRLAVVGFVKTLSQEIADSGVTLNIVGPGYHETPAINRLLDKKAEQENITVQEAKNKIASGIRMKRMGDPDDLGQLAAWLLSPASGYISGQTISVDGGQILSVHG